VFVGGDAKEKIEMKPSTLGITLGCAMLSSIALSEPAEAAPGLFPQELLPQPFPNPLPNDGDRGIAFVNGLLVGVTQPVPGKANTSARVPICVERGAGRVGHAYARKINGKWVTQCFVDGAPSPGAVIIKPTAQQGTNVKWGAMRKGQALPRALVSLDNVGTDRVPTYACKAGPSNAEVVGTLLPDGSCRLAPTLTEAAKTVDSSQVLLWSATGSVAPTFGWITIASGFPNPGGELLRWTATGPIYCSAGGRHGELLFHTTAATGKVGTVASCSTVVPGSAGRVPVSSGIRVFRNDAQSDVSFAFSGGTEVAEGSGKACVADDGAFGVVAGPGCHTWRGLRVAYRTMRARGPIPSGG
jgi:hypothetical protein